MKTEFNIKKVKKTKIKELKFKAPKNVNYKLKEVKFTL